MSSALPSSSFCQTEHVYVLRRTSRGFERSSAHRSEEHTSELQSHSELVCRLLPEKKSRGRRRGTRRGSGGLGVPAAVIPIVVGVFRPGVVVPIVIDVFGMDHLAAPVGAAVLGTL